MLSLGFEDETLWQWRRVSCRKPMNYVPTSLQLRISTLPQPPPNLRPRNQSWCKFLHLFIGLTQLMNASATSSAHLLYHSIDVNSFILSLVLLSSFTSSWILVVFLDPSEYLVSERLVPSFAIEAKREGHEKSCTRALLSYNKKVIFFPHPSLPPLFTFVSRSWGGHLTTTSWWEGKDETTLP